MLCYDSLLVYTFLCVSSYARVSELLGLFGARLLFELTDRFSEVNGGATSVIAVIFVLICDFGPWK